MTHPTPGGVLPGLAAITQDVQAAAALRGAEAPGLVRSPKGKEPEHAHSHPHGFWLLLGPGRGPVPGMLRPACPVGPAATHLLITLQPPPQGHGINTGWGLGREPQPQHSAAYCFLNHPVLRGGRESLYRNNLRPQEAGAQQDKADGQLPRGK